MKDDLDWIEPPVSAEKQDIVFSREAEGHEKKHNDFDAALAEMSSDGTLQSIMAKHGI